VHVPHYTHMFDQVLAGPRPWRFGHLYLPEGSRNLGSPEYDLVPGTKAPLTGTLMEVLSCLWLKDGRLLLLAVGLCRFRVRGLPLAVLTLLLCQHPSKKFFRRNTRSDGGAAWRVLSMVRVGIPRAL
jgi:Lon protease-like protein